MAQALARRVVKAKRPAAVVSALGVNWPAVQVRSFAKSSPTRTRTRGRFFGKYGTFWGRRCNIRCSRCTDGGIPTRLRGGRCSLAGDGRGDPGGGAGDRQSQPGRQGSSVRIHTRPGVVPAAGSFVRDGRSKKCDVDQRERAVDLTGLPKSWSRS